MSSELEVIEEDGLLMLKYMASGSLLCLSALFAGLTLGLLGLDKVALEIVMKCGDPKESSYAKKIMPLRNRGHLLLCTLLLGNVMTNSLLSIVLADATSGFVGFLLSTALITTFGEIFPQAICSKYALAIGARTVWIVKIFMFLLFPVAYPLSLLLDKMLGEDFGQIYTKLQLKELFNIHLRHSEESGLKESDSNLLKNAIDLSLKSAKRVVTPIHRVFALEVSEKLDAQTLALIGRSGFSRIPIYEFTKDRILGLIYAKDLLTVDPLQGISVRSMLETHGHPIIRISHDAKLDVLLCKLKSGSSRFALIERSPHSPTTTAVSTDETVKPATDIFNGKKPSTTAGGGGGAFNFAKKKTKSEEEDQYVVSLPLLGGGGGPEELLSNSAISEFSENVGESDFFSENDENESECGLNGVLGIVTLEDVYEELTRDVFVGRQDSLPIASNPPSELNVFINRSTQSSRQPQLQPISTTLNPSQNVDPLNQQIVAYLSQFVEPFKPLSQETISKIVSKAQVLDFNPPSNQDDVFLYQRGMDCDYFMLLLSGKLEVTSGDDCFVSFLGPWGCLGGKALRFEQFECDFSARVIQACRVLKITHRVFAEAQVGAGASPDLSYSQHPPICGEMTEFAASSIPRGGKAQKIPAIPPPSGFRAPQQSSDVPEFSLMDGNPPSLVLVPDDLLGLNTTPTKTSTTEDVAIATASPARLKNSKAKSNLSGPFEDAAASTSS